VSEQHFAGSEPVASLSTVEAPGGLWRLCRDDETLCGELAVNWPVVLHAVERRGIWCGRCLWHIQERA
jgi:hypothetical protein